MLAFIGTLTNFSGSILYLRVEMGHLASLKAPLWSRLTSRKRSVCGRGTLCCPGLHPSQQLTKYDGEVVPTTTQNGTAQRLSSQGSGGSAEDHHTAVSSPASEPGSTGDHPTQDVSDLYSLPSHVAARQQARGEPAATDGAASYQYGGPYLRDSDDRKSSLSGDQTVL